MWHEPDIVLAFTLISSCVSLTLIAFYNIEILNLIESFICVPLQFKQYIFRHRLEKHVLVQKHRNHNCALWLEWMELKMRESKNLLNKVTLWPQSFLRTSLLYRCLTQSIAIQILININLLISIKIRLPLDQFSLASVWHCRPLITQMTPPPHHSHTHIHTQRRQPLTLASIRLTVSARVSTVIKKCPWCNFMPVDTHGPHAKDYGMSVWCRSVRHCRAGGPWSLYGSL